MATTSFTKRTVGLETAEPPIVAMAATTPAGADGATPFAKKPKLVSGRSRKREIPEGLWTKCPRCSTMVFDKEMDGQ